MLYVCTRDDFIRVDASADAPVVEVIMPLSVNHRGFRQVMKSGVSQ